MPVYDYITDTGIIKPDALEILKNVEDEFKTVAGRDVTLDSSSFEGRLIEAETRARISAAEACSFIVNQINPTLSTGVFLDALCALTGAIRVSDEYSTVECQLDGTIGTVVPQGALVSDTLNQRWVCSNAVTFVTNNITASFHSQDTGKIDALPNTINKIITPVLGWDTVNNKDKAVLGRDTQTDFALKHYRQKLIGKNAHSNSYAVIASVASVKGVRGVSFFENVTDAPVQLHTDPHLVPPQTIRVDPHSIYTCVDGGSDTDIAEALQAKGMGCGYSGSVIVKYTDQWSKQVIDVKFDRPVQRPIYISVIISAGTPSSIIDNIKKTIIDYSQQDHDPNNGFALGVNTSPFEISSALNKVYPTLFIRKLELSTDNATFSCDTILTAINEISTIDISNIRVNVQ